MTNGARTELKAEIERQARDAGFDVIGFADANLPAEYGNRLREFISEERHGDMAWMEARLAERVSPRVLWPQARSAIILAMNYGPEKDPLDALTRHDRAAISVYANNKDYHDVVKKSLKQIGRWLALETGCQLKVFVDTAPVMEKPLAATAGVGWQGKHTNLVSRQFGSWLFLGVILTTLEIPADQPARNSCGACRRCLDICPTDAFPAPYQLDARKCVSYLTIEHKGPIPKSLRPGIGNRIYGCDDCLAICPWNKFASKSAEVRFHPREELQGPLLSQLARLTDPEFRTLFSGSPIKRIGRNRFVRNVAIALGNSADASSLAALRELINDENALVRGAAVWALKQLAPPEQFQRARQTCIDQEKDAEVLAEWND